MKYFYFILQGLSDGSVAVYNLQLNDQQPSYISTAKNGKHKDMVWQVRNYIFLRK